jgi:hypothetical protein
MVKAFNIFRLAVRELVHFRLAEAEEETQPTKLLYFSLSNPVMTFCTQACVKIHIHDFSFFVA